MLERLCSGFLKAWKPISNKAAIVLYACAIRHLLSYFGKTRGIRDIIRRDADKFLAAQTHYRDKPKKRLSESPRAQIVRISRTIFRTAVRWQWIVQSPFANVRMPKPGIRRWHRLTVPEYRKLMDASPDLRWKTFYALASTSGARVGEFFDLG